MTIPNTSTTTNVAGFGCHVKVGHTIPDFTLEAYHNEKLTKVSLAEQRGEVACAVLLPGGFYVRVPDRA